MAKVLIVFYVLTISLIYNAYNYANHQVDNAFSINGSKMIVENPKFDLLHTKQDYNFNLLNISDKSVELLSIELQDYQGIKLGTLTASGRTLEKQKVKSNRVYSSAATNNQGLLVEYQVEILDSSIHNPTSALITYSYLGIKHQQVIDFPGLNKPGTTTLSAPLKNFHISIISTVIALIFLIVIYRNREAAEAYLGLKLFGYYYLGAFNLNFNILIPLGIIVILCLFRPIINAKVKMYAALGGFTFMMLSYLLPNYFN